MKAKPLEANGALVAFLAEQAVIEPRLNTWTRDAAAANAAKISYTASGSLGNSYNAADVLRQAKGVK